MREEYEIENLNPRPNPYLAKLRGQQSKQTITINLNTDTVAYFKDLAVATGIPYQTLINMELSDCAANHRKPDLSWK